MKKHRLDILAALIIFILALTVRITAASHILAGDHRFFMGDDDDYYYIAMSLIKEGVFGIDGEPTAYRMPFFPLFVAFWHLLFGSEPYAILPVLLFVSALIPLGTFLLGMSLHNRLAGLFASLLIVFDGDFIVYSHTYMTETLFSALVLGSMLALARLRVTHSWKWAWSAGLLLGITSITRANFGPFIGLIVLWLLWYGRSRGHTAFWQATLVGGMVLMIWTPWVIRNYVTFGVLIPFTTQGGNAYYGIYNDLHLSPQPNGMYGYWVWVIPDPPQVQDQVWDEVTLDRWQREQARAWREAHPREALQIALRQMAYVWIPEVSIYGWFVMVWIGLPALVVVTLRWHHPDLILWLLLVLTVTAMSAMAVGVGRFSVPLRPILAVTTSIAYLTIARFIQQTIIRYRMSMKIDSPIIVASMATQSGMVVRDNPNEPHPSITDEQCEAPHKQ
ncbi:glycosyltransferase family 39 protein [Candidatus Chloroploca sp. M-50]|uniref:Glycosyltransferase family 39 protein n=1 Tax=Candidatus Chloroploca mongolica TaxID=2528176 RepID=A0ABS4DD03_9CHLR|nr:glycosyltransferase family 39 protein [Candidatus Chloroploca mongolica]MBP1467314.1 glycosyltransferase family 39 protein [Candidatus Chloroploca mongolica]